MVGCNDKNGSSNAAEPKPTVQMNGSGVIFNGKSMTIRRDNLPPATISADGALSIDGKSVALDDAQRQAMR
ncbi:hypothetical protein CKY51_22230, partial [Xanthomonas maliensis]